MTTELKERIEQLECQLAGCMTAATGWAKDPPKQGDWGWSKSFQDVLDLRTKYETLLRQHAVSEPSKGLLSEPVQAFLRSTKGVSLDLSSYQDGDDELPAPAHAAEQPKENWQPMRGQYVWVEGKLTENQPETFPKKLRVYVHGVGTGIAENVRPVTETEAEQPKLTEEQVQSIFVPMLNERAGSWEPFPWDKLVERLNRLLTSPVAPPPQQKEKP